MERLIAFDPDAQVIGQAILGAIRCPQGDEILPILKAHGLDNVEPAEWYPHQVWLDFLRDVAQQGGQNATSNLVAIGMGVAETAPEAVESFTLETALLSMNVTYQMSHRGEAGGFVVTVVDERHIQIVDYSPYPDDFTYGFLYALARRFRPSGARFAVIHDDAAPCRKKGDDSCTYHVTWEAS
jgi:hypothetical protein